ncbi:MAG: prepilin-type N-terminal cleavage/methylation domain-containing protein [Armatimonadota bacterium]|nr:prepilin-type N-terminal cleavage/methylation domain-containing protein [bacterium]
MKGRKGFTLIELLVVIAIIAILAAILFPVFAKAKRSAQTANCQSNLNQIGKAFKMYLSDWEDTFPTNRNTSGALSVEVLLSLEDNGSGDPEMQNNGKPLRFKNGVNWVEALYNYVEPVSNQDDPNSVWKCQAAAVKDLTSGSLGCVSYAYNYNMLEMSEGAVSGSANLMLVRELDRFAHAICRPTNNSTGTSNNANTPQNVFLDSLDEGTGSSSISTSPKMHGTGSNILFADGHVRNFDLSYFPETNKLNIMLSRDTTSYQWFNIAKASYQGKPQYESIAITPY